MRLQGKKVIVTGGARGIGYGITDRFLKEGAQVVVLDKNAEALDTAIAGWQQQHLPASGIRVDLREREALTRAGTEAWDRLGGVDILINNAGIAIKEHFLDVSSENWDLILDVNLNAMFTLSQFIAKRMVEQGKGGNIVNTTSKNGLVGSRDLSHYNTSKGGIVLLTQSMAADLAVHDIRVNAVAPGFVFTPMIQELREKAGVTVDPDGFARTPMRREGTVEEVANAYLFLASDEASYITGICLVVDGGHLAVSGDV